MRDLIAYAGAPEEYLRPYADSSAVTPEAIQLVNYLDGILKDRGQFAPNCILYRQSPAAPSAREQCYLSGGPLFTLGNWDNSIDVIWVREGYQLTLIQNGNFDKSEGLMTFSGATLASSEGQKINGA